MHRHRADRRRPRRRRRRRRRAHASTGPVRVRRRARRRPAVRRQRPPTRSTAATARTCSTAAPATTCSAAARATTRSTAAPAATRSAAAPGSTAPHTRCSPPRRHASVSLDGVANDGLPGEGDDFGVRHRGRVDPRPGRRRGRRAASTLIGSAGPNELVTDDGNDTISGRRGHRPRRRPTRATTRSTSRDGFRTGCAAAPGTDTVFADTLDLIGADCETVNVADAGNALDDRPPTSPGPSPRRRAARRPTPRTR